MNIIVDGLLTHYERNGKGPLLLLLHGWGDSAATFQNLQKQLRPHYEVVAVDLPGFGASEPPKAAWDLDNYAGFLQAFLTKLTLEQPYAVIGHSNGGALAVRAVSLEKLQPQKIILLAASGVRTNNTFKRLSLKFIAKVGNIATLWMPEKYRRALRKSLYGAVGSDMLVAPHLQDTFKKTVRQDVQADAVVIAVPTLLIYAAHDEAIPLADGKQYHDLITGSQLVVVENAGHFVHQEQPEQVQKLIEEFLST